MDKLSGVQDLLDQNKLLISEINQNHELRTPDALQRNALLIRQLNKNIATVVDLYTSLTSLVEPFGAQQQQQQQQQQEAGGAQAMDAEDAGLPA